MNGHKMLKTLNNGQKNYSRNIKCLTIHSFDMNESIMLIYNRKNYENMFSNTNYGTSNICRLQKSLQAEHIDAISNEKTLRSTSQCFNNLYLFSPVYFSTFLCWLFKAFTNNESWHIENT